MKICMVNVGKHGNSCKKRNARVAAKLIDPGLHGAAKDCIRLCPTSTCKH